MRCGDGYAARPPGHCRASTIVPLETQEQLRQALPQVEIVTLPGLGHYPSDEKPAEFLAIVNRFLKRLNFET